MCSVSNVVGGGGPILEFQSIGVSEKKFRKKTLFLQAGALHFVFAQAKVF